MSPEEHFNRLRDERVWAAGTSAATASREDVPAPRRARESVWVMVVVGGLVVAGSAVVLHLAGAAGAVGGSGAAAVASSSPMATSVAPRVTPSASPSQHELPAYEYDVHDPADVARADAALACYRAHGVRFVELEAPDDDGIAMIGYGGPSNDARSIALGLKYESVCQ